MVGRFAGVERRPGRRRLDSRHDVAGAHTRSGGLPAREIRDRAGRWRATRPPPRDVPSVKRGACARTTNVRDAVAMLMRLDLLLFALAMLAYVVVRYIGYVPDILLLW
jgi:hypothetical protein